jgi:G protein-coupled receptor Mth (Methuselah protein)
MNFFYIFTGKIFEHDQYCLDHVLDGKYEGVQVFTCSAHYKEVSPILTPYQDDTRFALYSIGLFISVLFLLATLAVGFLLLSNHHMLHWRCQTNYVICLLIGDLLLAVTQIGGTNIHGPWCLIIAHLMHFFFLSSFFWLNTLSFNIWYTFR